MLNAFVYMLECSDGSYYVGLARGTDLSRRVAEHQDGVSTKAYTFTRRPVTLVWAEHFEQLTEAIAAERRIKGWSRVKKQALIAGDWAALRTWSKRPSARSKAAPE